MVASSIWFRKRSHKKGDYVDGHEREDVITYCTEYLDMTKDLRETYLPPPLPSDEHLTTPPPDAEKKKRNWYWYTTMKVFSTPMKDSSGFGDLEMNHTSSQNPKVQESWFPISLTSTLDFYCLEKRNTAAHVLQIQTFPDRHEYC